MGRSSPATIASSSARKGKETVEVEDPAIVKARREKERKEQLVKDEAAIKNYPRWLREEMPGSGSVGQKQAQSTTSIPGRTEAPLDNENVPVVNQLKDTTIAGLPLLAKAGGDFLKKPLSKERKDEDDPSEPS